MFKFLKDKLKKAVQKFSKRAEEEVVEEKVEDKQAIEAAKKAEQAERAAKAKKAQEIADTKEAIAHRKEEKARAKEKKKKEKEKKREEAKAKKEEEKKEKEKKKEEATAKKEEAKPAEEKKEENAPEPEEEQVEEKKEEKAPEEEVPEEEVTEVPEDVEEFSEEVEEEKVEEVEEEPEPEPEVEEEPEPEVEEEPEEEPEPGRRGLFGKLKEAFTKKQLSDEKFDELFWELELAMLENNVAVEVIEKIKNDLKRELTSGKVSRKGVDQLITDALRTSIEELFLEPYDLVKKIKAARKKDPKRPYIICFVGVNGSGKTTTLAKVANMFQENDLTVVMAASDTFRAAAIDQLQQHANTLAIKLISQGYGADPAAVAFDAVEHAKARNIDVVMIDTAGRLHSNTNLMAELEKVVRVAKPDLKIFIGESITGNDCVEQAKEFDKIVSIDAIILSKADVDEKGGAAISVSYVTGKPILYLGVGQAYGDLVQFDKEKIIRSMGL